MKYPHVAQRLFNQPLMIRRPKLDVLLRVVGPRLGLEVELPSPELESTGSEDDRVGVGAQTDDEPLAANCRSHQKASPSFLCTGPWSRGPAASPDGLA